MLGQQLIQNNMATKKGYSVRGKSGKNKSAGTSRRIKRT